ncbi:MAG TPA: hypothetical protein VIT67_22975 [Povalibacter sp.]
MSRPTVVEVNFQEFKRAVDSAIAAGTRILPREKDRWEQYVATNQVRELNFQAYARGKYEKLEPVIIDAGPPWGGYYLWSASEEVALRWQRPLVAGQDGEAS